MHKLIHGDCLESLKKIPNNSIDLIVTDPPYKITARGNGGNSGGMFQKSCMTKQEPLLITMMIQSFQIGKWAT